MKFTREPMIVFSAILAIAIADGARATAQANPGTGGYTSFGVNLYKELVGEKPGTNVFISPASIGFALSMTMNGAAGGTRDAMAKTLGLAGSGIEAASAADSILIGRMNDSIRAVRLSVANSLWARRGVRFKEDFLRCNKRYYGADIRALSTAAAINDWVAEKTNDRITKIVDTIDPGTILFLINAIYFKGTWSKEFDKNLTREEPFNLAGGSTSRRPMMRQSGRYDYLDGEGFQAVRLPYGDGRIGMYVFLPAGNSSLEQFHEGLTGEKLIGWIGDLAERAGTVRIPRFRLEYEATLNRSLSALGMAIAFDTDRANFTRMFESVGTNAYIHEVRHKTFVEVNEEGTEAAAVTSVEMRATSAMVEKPPFEMIVDRPFFLAIVDGKTGLVLFMGSIVNPR
ncbi:MAG: serpin family protein [Candidatus Krumholzibacteria bacterium]|nr:serpin family protein [Candidatus Krumholzibacteria bacterium]